MRPSSEIRSNPVTYSIQSIASGIILALNTKSSSVLVVTFISLINTSSQSGDAMLLIDSVTNAAVHSGDVGSGSFDRFPLSCEIALLPGHGLRSLAQTGAWDVVVTGYFTPLVEAP